MAKDDGDDFEKMDQEAGVAVEAEILPPERRFPSVPPNMGVMEFRDKLVQSYHRGSPSLTDKLRKMGKDGELEFLLLSLIDEMIKETDHLLGNELVSATNGDLRDSSVISFKRAEVIEKAIKAVQAKQAFERERGLDLDSPSMVVVYRFFMSKVRDTFHHIGITSEQSDLFFRTLGEEMEDWKKELRLEFDALKGQG
jgi:hypothetical protein